MNKNAIIRKLKENEMGKERMSESYCIGLINKIDDVLNLDIDYYYRVIVVRELISDYRKK